MVTEKQKTQVARILQRGICHIDRILDEVTFRKNKLDTLMICLSELELDLYVEKSRCHGCSVTSVYELTQRGYEKYGIMGNPWS